MSTISDRKQHLNVNDSQMEMNTRGSSSAPLNEDFSGKLKEAQSQLEKLQKQQAEVERQRKELKQLNESKEEFIHGQVEITEKLTTAVTAMDREIFAARQEIEELEQARICFADHLEKIDQLDPDTWSNETLKKDLARAMSVLDLAEDEFEQACDHFSGGRSASIFDGGPTKSKRVSANTSSENEFFTMFRNGLAFNLPVVLLGAIALLIYLIK